MASSFQSSAEFAWPPWKSTDYDRSVLELVVRDGQANHVIDLLDVNRDPRVPGSVRAIRRFGPVSTARSGSPSDRRPLRHRRSSHRVAPISSRASQSVTFSRPQPLPRHFSIKQAFHTFSCVAAM